MAMIYYTIQKQPAQSVHENECSHEFSKNLDLVRWGPSKTNVKIIFENSKINSLMKRYDFSNFLVAINFKKSIRWLLPPINEITRRQCKFDIMVLIYSALLIAFMSNWLKLLQICLCLLIGTVIFFRRR